MDSPGSFHKHCRAAPGIKKQNIYHLKPLLSLVAAALQEPQAARTGRLSLQLRRSTVPSKRTARPSGPGSWSSSRSRGGPSVSRPLGHGGRPRLEATTRSAAALLGHSPAFLRPIPWSLPALGLAGAVLVPVGTCCSCSRRKHLGAGCGLTGRRGLHFERNRWGAPGARPPLGAAQVTVSGSGG